MKYSLPLFATVSLTVLLWGACQPQNSDLDDGKGGYQAPAPATNGDMSDTGDYTRRNREADTLHPTPPPPVHPDSTNRMPPR
jgi:hypothetical protein